VLTIAATLHSSVQTRAVIAVVGVAKAFETIADVIAGNLQKLERLDQVARCLVVRGAASVVTFALSFWASRNLLVAVTALAATWLLVIAFYDLRVVSKLMPKRQELLRFSAAAIKRLIIISLPLGIVMTLVSLNLNLPRYILVKKLGTGELGIFASLAYLMTAVSLIVVALGQSVSTRMSKLFAANQFAEFSNLLRKLLVLAFLLGLAALGFAAIFGRSLITLIYRAEYAAHLDLLLIMVTAAGVSAIASFIGFAMTSARCFRSQVPVMAATVLVTFSMTLLLVPHLGLVGAGVAILAGTTVQAMASFVILQFTIRRRQAVHFEEPAP
jgi:O-antigen/teichoic acid export membrane protein